MSSGSIEKLNLDSAIATSFYKNRGDVAVVCKELPDVNPDYVLRVMKKLRKKLQYDVAYHLSLSIGATIWSGVQQRIIHLTDCLTKLREIEEGEVSTCCDRPVRIVIETVEGEEVPSFYCTKCGRRTLIHTIRKRQILQMVLEYIRELREEDKFTLEFAEKMGFTLRDSLPPAPVFKQNVLVVGDKKVVFSEEDKQILEELDELNPQERQRTRKALEAKIVEASKVNKDGSDGSASKKD